MLKILFTGGGTGGHIYPIIAIAREVKVLAQKTNTPVKLSFAGPADFNLEVIRQEGIEVYVVPSGKFRRYASLQAPWDLIKAIWGFFYSLFLLWYIMPDVIFAKGGYGSFGVALAGRLYAIPLLVHDSDSIPGLVSRLLGKIANRVAISFPTAVPYFGTRKSAFLGNPIRTSLLQASKEKAGPMFDLKGGRPLVFIMGGSQGSLRINEVVAASLKEMVGLYEVLHQVGSNNVDEYLTQLKEVYSLDPKSEPYYHVKGYFNEAETANAFAACDIVISRAGAGTIYEIAAWGKPSLLIPLADAAFDHQRANAFFYARTGAAVVVEESNLSPHVFLNELKGIAESKNRQADMAKAAKEFAKPDAAEKIAKGILELAS